MYVLLKNKKKSASFFVPALSHWSFARDLWNGTEERWWAVVDLNGLYSSHVYVPSGRKIGAPTNTHSRFFGGSVRFDMKTEADHRSSWTRKPKPNCKTDNSVRFQFGLVWFDLVWFSVFSKKCPPLLLPTGQPSCKLLPRQSNPPTPIRKNEEGEGWRCYLAGLCIGRQFNCGFMQAPCNDQQA
jgi:hypothetical protein